MSRKGARSYATSIRPSPPAPKVGSGAILAEIQLKVQSQSRPKPLFFKGEKPPEPVTLDYGAFPHILLRILTYCDAPTLSTTLRCSRALFDVSSRILYRDIRLHGPDGYRAFKGAAGRAAMARAIRSFAPSLYRALSHTRSLSLLGIPEGDYLTYSTEYGYMPDGIWTDTRILRMAWDDGGTIDLFRDLLDLPRVDHLILRANTVDLAYLGREEVQEWLPEATARITILASNLASFGEPDLLDDVEEIGETEYAITVVLLPHNTALSQMTYSTLADSASTNGTWYRPFTETLVRLYELAKEVPTACPFEIVGLEYAQGYATGYIPDEELRRLWDLLREGQGREKTLSNVVFRRFEEWLDEQEEGMMFSREDEARFRGRSKAHREKWGDKAV